MKIILVLLDGVGDRSYKILNHKTPLQSARTPNLDRIATLGSNGLFHAALPGQCLPSETAHYLLFGYDLEHFPGRGLLEGVGYGLSFDDGDVLSLAHLAGIRWQGGVPMLAHGREEIKGDVLGLARLYASLTPYESQSVRFRLHQTEVNDAVLILSGPVSPFVSDADPMVVGRPIAKVLPLAKNPEPEKAAITAGAMNDYLTYCCKVLSQHEMNLRRQASNLPSANFLAPQRCGRRIPQEPFEKRWDLSGLFIASGAVFEGLAHELGLAFRKVDDGQDPGADLRDRVQIALWDRSHDFIHIHTKVPDEASHTGDPKAKEAAIAALDKGLDELVSAVEERDDLIVAVTGDHSTPSMSSLIHSGETVPVALVGPTVRRDKVASFDEVSCGRGCLGVLRGKELMLTLLNYADRSSLFGHRLGNTDRPYVPRVYEYFERTWAEEDP